MDQLKLWEADPSSQTSRVVLPAEYAEMIVGRLKEQTRARWLTVAFPTECAETVGRLNKQRPEEFRVPVLETAYALESVS